ncbi:Uncharacterized protein dnm_056980 [Desulfonema magnum]|uniref:Uncharacterized protein n=1 Tax=Desulfonema magnum TaxID=45655 RepID=A0A975BQJ1_9BACT|nr:Uncharacterized protein dnm_056980 [Desulfonema magnum]
MPESELSFEVEKSRNQICLINIPKILPAGVYPGTKRLI